MENVSSANTNSGNQIDQSALAVERKPFSTVQKLFAIAAAVIVLIVVVIGLLSRKSASAELTETTNRAAVPLVNVTSIAPAKGVTELILPGTTQSFIETAIYARTNGYLKRWYFDIGAHVRQGQLLAQIETPELDAQLRQARADLDTAQANARLAGITAERTANLLKSQSVSTQERDNAAGAYSADQAIVASRQADVARLLELQSYEKG